MIVLTYPDEQSLENVLNLVADFNPKVVVKGGVFTVIIDADLGVELVLNGDFLTDTDWEYGDGWSIANNKLNANQPVVGRAVQNNVVEIGKLYFIVIDILSVNQAGLSVFLGTNSVGLISIAGVQYFILTSDGTRLDIASWANNNLDAEVDSISVREIL